MASRRPLHRPLLAALALRGPVLLLEGPGDVGDDAPGLPLELPVGEAEDGATGGAQVEIARVVALEGD